MKSKEKIAIAVGALFTGVAVLSMVACNGGDGGSSTGTDVPMTTCQPAQPVVFPTPENLPSDLREYQSPERGYIVRYPVDWQAKPNQASYQNISGDTFFASAPIGDVRPNVTITCETVPVGTDSRTYVDAKQAVLEQLIGTSPGTAAVLQVDGKDAYGWQYRLSAQTTPTPQLLDKVEVLFADDRGGWTISLVVPGGQVSTYKAIFDAMVASFHEE